MDWLLLFVDFMILSVCKNLVCKFYLLIYTLILTRTYDTLSFLLSVSLFPKTGKREPSPFLTTYQTKRFSTFTNGLRELSEWLSSNSCKDVYMESTGKYWYPVFNILEDSCNVIVAHPKYVKAIRGKKTLSTN